MSAPTPAAISANFPNQTLTPFATDAQPPTFRSLTLLEMELNENAQSVHSPRGGGLHGHLTLTITPAAYLLRANVSFIVPHAPGETPARPPNATAAQISEAIRAHAENTRVFTLYHDTDRALVRLIVAACPPTYLQALRDPVYGYGPTTTLRMLTHLKTTYGVRTITDRNANFNAMNAPWVPPTPIENLFQELAAGTRAAANNNEAIPDIQQALIGYNIINSTGLFTQGCREWRLLPAADQTYARFVTHFTEQNRERIASAPTTAMAGYHGAAMTVTKVPPAPDLPSIMREMALLKAQLARLTTSPAPGAPEARGYCWTHGSSRNTLHNSATCNAKAPGHIDTATADNPCGGSTKVWVAARPARGTTTTPNPPTS